MRPLKIGFVSAEVTPFAKTGGLGDVAAALPRFLHRDGHDLRVILPRYGSVSLEGRVVHKVAFAEDVPVEIGAGVLRFSLLTTRLPGSDLPVHLVDCPAMYHREGIYTSDPDEALRFALLCRAALETFQRMGFAPDVIHCHDWHASLLPLYLKTHYAWDRLFARTRTLLTIHNIGYQGVFGADLLGALRLAGHADLLPQDDLRAGRVNVLRAGVLHADAISTVSRTYAEEIQTPAYGMGLEDLLGARRRVLVGIVNGVDYGEWNPETDPHIASRYSSRRLAGKRKNKETLLSELGLSPANGAPVLGVISRLSRQKGLDLLFPTIPDLLSRRDLRLVVLGSGESRLEHLLHRLERSFPGRVCFYRGFSETLAHRIEAGCDLFLMPSLYEPCGLNQMFSLRYGTVPVVRRTGGLADTVEPYDPASGGGTGFVFEHFTPEGLAWALGLALEVFGDRRAWVRLMRNGMARDFSWEVQGRHYVDLYARLAGV